MEGREEKIHQYQPERLPQKVDNIVGYITLHAYLRIVCTTDFYMFMLAPAMLTFMAGMV